MVIKLTDEEIKEFVFIRELLSSDNNELMLLAYSLCLTFFEKLNKNFCIEHYFIKGVYRNVKEFFNLNIVRNTPWFYYYETLNIIDSLIKGKDVFIER